MLVNIRPSVGYGYTLEPVSFKRLTAIARDQEANGMTAGAGEPVYFQGWEDLESSLSGVVSPRAMSELSEGYPVSCRMDAWTVRQLFGYSSN